MVFLFEKESITQLFKKNRENKMLFKVDFIFVKSKTEK